MAANGYNLRRRTTTDVGEEKDAGKEEAEKVEKEEKPTKRYREKTRFPPIDDMLAFGAPENEGKPKTWMGMIAGPLILAILFFISFQIFINAPHHLSQGHQRKPFAMNQKPHLEKKRRREMEEMRKKKEDEMEQMKQKKPEGMDPPPQTREAVLEHAKKAQAAVGAAGQVNVDAIPQEVVQEEAMN